MYNHCTSNSPSKIMTLSRILFVTSFFPLSGRKKNWQKQLVSKPDYKTLGMQKFITTLSSTADHSLHFLSCKDARYLTHNQDEDALKQP